MNPESLSHVPQRFGVHTLADHGVGILAFSRVINTGVDSNLSRRAIGDQFSHVCNVLVAEQINVSIQGLTGTLDILFYAIRHGNVQ